MGAFQSNDAHDHGTPDAFDLSLDVTVAEGAMPPRYESPSASQFAIYAHRFLLAGSLLSKSGRGDNSERKSVPTKNSPISRKRP